MIAKQDLAILLFVLWNVVAFICYAVDKYKAIHHHYRIPEKTLLSLALFLGGIGSYMAGKICHHKTRKWYFKGAWLLGILIDIVLIYFVWRKL